MYGIEYLNIMIENMVNNKKAEDISNVIENAQVNYVSNAATVSKSGFNAYKKFINKFKTELQKETSNIDKSTIWEKIKRIEGRKNGV